MQVTRFDPFRELERRMLRSFGDALNTDEANISGFTPTVNTREGEYAYHVEVDLPGVNKEGIHVDVKDNMLSISGERSYKDEVKKEDYYKVESSFGKFQRSFSLPDNADTEMIQAACNEGVLEVTIPKRKEAESKKIAIQ